MGHSRTTTNRAGALMAAVLVLGATGVLAPPGSSPAAPGIAHADHVAVPAGTVQVGTSQRALTGTNVARTSNALVMYTPAWGASTRTNQYGFEAVVVGGRITAVRPGAGDSAIPADGYVLSGHGEARTWLAAVAAVGVPVWTAGQAPTHPPAEPAKTVTVAGQTRALDGTDVARQANFLVKYTPAWGTSTRTNAYGFEAAVVGGRVTQVADTTGNMPIPADGYVLSGHGDDRTWLKAHATVGAAVGDGTGGTSPTEKLPDLVMRTLTGITIDTTQTPGVRRLEFPGVTANIGTGPFELDGTRSSSTSDDWQLTQTITMSDGTRRTRPVTGTTLYYAGDGHSHWHLRDLDLYELRNANGQRLRTGEKHGFCFEDNTQYRDWPATGRNGAPATPVYTTANVCGVNQPAATAVKHALSVGWGDTYPVTLPDQYIDVSGLGNGRYRVQVTADWADWLRESDEANNTSWADIQINDDQVTVIATGGGA